MKPRPNGKSNDHSRSPDILDKLERRKLELDPLIDAWAQQQGETPRNYGLFLMYRDLGRIRTIGQVATMGPLTFAAMARVSRYNKWVERAGLWDAEQDRIAAIRLHDAREEMARNHTKAARLMMDKALERLKSIDVKAISPHALVLMLDAAARIERFALGLEGKAAVPTVTVAATTTTDETGRSAMRVEVGVQHDQIMATLDQMVSRMSPEQLAAGYQELTASAEEATRALDAALPTPPPS